jgi:hypothetical protein
VKVVVSDVSVIVAAKNEKNATNTHDDVDNVIDKDATTTAAFAKQRRALRSLQRKWLDREDGGVDARRRAAAAEAAAAAAAYANDTFAARLMVGSAGV